MTLVARISPWLSRVPSVLSSMTLRASTASPSRMTVVARKLETRWYWCAVELREAMISRSSPRGSPAALAVSSNRAPASLCVPSARPARASSAIAATSAALANSKARRQSFAAARPIFETPFSSCSPGARSFVLPRRCVIVVGSDAASTFASSSGGVGGALGRQPPDHRTGVARRSECIGEFVNEDQLRVADADDCRRASTANRREPCRCRPSCRCGCPGRGASTARST